MTGPLHVPLGWLARWTDRRAIRALKKCSVGFCVLGHVHPHDPDHEITQICRYRVRRAAEIARQVKPQLVMFTGWGGLHGQRSEASQMLDEWPEDASERLILEQRARDTAENALAALPLFSSYRPRLDLVVVITSWWHAPRAYLLFWLVFRKSPLKVRILVVWPRQISLRQLRVDAKLVMNELRCLFDALHNLREGRAYLKGSSGR